MHHNRPYLYQDDFMSTRLMRFVIKKRVRCVDRRGCGDPRPTLLDRTYYAGHVPEWAMISRAQVQDRYSHYKELNP